MLESSIQTQLIRRGISDAHVLHAMRSVDRSLFIPEDKRCYAEEDSPIPIGEGQTISQPYIVAYMTEQLQLTKEHRALEIGTGSAYQTAILAELCAEVYSIERIPALYQQAQERLQDLGYQNIHLQEGDGYHGWPEHAPYDVILVSAAAPTIPETLVSQLAEGGRMIIPVGGRWEFQSLKLIQKQGGQVSRQNLLGVSFVPFVSDAF